MAKLTWETHEEIKAKKDKADNHAKAVEDFKGKDFSKLTGKEKDLLLELVAKQLGIL